MRYSAHCLAIILYALGATHTGLAADPHGGGRSGARPLVIGHRGDPTRAPENTLASFESAVGEGVDFVELDVHLSKDHQIVVIHDEKVDRTTNGHGKVADLTLAQIQALDAGSWFRGQFKGERIPTLEQALVRCKGRVRVLVDLKNVEPEGALECAGRAEELVKASVALIERLGLKNEVRFHTFFPNQLAALKTHAHGIPYDFLWEFTEKNHAAVLFAKQHRASGINPSFAATTRSQVLLAHALGLTVCPYFEDSEADYSQAVALGVDGIITNHPHELAAWLDRAPAL